MYINSELENRVNFEANLAIGGLTVRQIAKKIGVSKSTVYFDITKRLENSIISEKVNMVLQENKINRHIRGGEATRRKYLEKQNK